jgi:hypothetical protein
MKLTIEIDDELHVKSYLSILSIGILECLEKKLITYDDTMNLLFSPGLVDKFETKFPDLCDAIHLATELEDVAELIPEKLNEAIKQIKMLNEKSINFVRSTKQHVFYKIEN